MPLTSKGSKIKSAMVKEYGEKKAEEVFYASRNKGSISGVDVQRRAVADRLAAGFYVSGRDMAKLK